MTARLDYFASPSAGKVIKYLMSAGRALKEGPLPTATQELVSLRVSQINGCAVCIDMHAKEAVAAGETHVRLNLVPGWREATVFTEAERAALWIAEEGTRVADAGEGISDEAWEYARKHYDEEQLTFLVVLVSMMNAVNRLNILTRQPATGDYQAGQFH
jgi:AhpD family alkylhydroperoxidase